MTSVCSSETLVIHLKVNMRRNPEHSYRHFTAVTTAHFILFRFFFLLCLVSVLPDSIVCVRSEGQ